MILVFRVRFANDTAGQSTALVPALICIAADAELTRLPKCHSTSLILSEVLVFLGLC